MTDEPTIDEQIPEPGQIAAPEDVDERVPAAPDSAPPDEDAPSGGLKGFLSSSTGRVVMIGGAVALLAIVAAVVAFVVMGSLSGPSEPQVTPPATTAGTQGAASKTATAAKLPESVTVEDIPLREVFTPRDPFKVLTLPPEKKSGASASGGFTPSTDENEVLVVEIVSEDGDLKAVIETNGERYTVGEGQRVGESSWQVQKISSTSVTLLYGDEQVTLGVGQGLQK